MKLLRAAILYFVQSVSQSHKGGHLWCMVEQTWSVACFCEFDIAYISLFYAFTMMKIIIIYLLYKFTI